MKFLLQNVTYTKYNQTKAFETWRERQCLLFHVYHNLKHYEYVIKAVNSNTLQLICAQCPAVVSVKLANNIKTTCFKELTSGGKKRRILEISKDVSIKDLMSEDSYEGVYQNCIPKYCATKCVSIHKCAGYAVQQCTKRQYRTTAIKLHEKIHTFDIVDEILHVTKREKPAGWLEGHNVNKSSVKRAMSYVT